MTKEQAQQESDAISKQYEDLTGIEYSAYFTDDQLIVTTVTNYAKLDPQQIIQLSGENYEGDPEAIRNVSLKQSEEVILQQGFTEKQ